MGPAVLPASPLLRRHDASPVVTAIYDFVSLYLCGLGPSQVLRLTSGLGERNSSPPREIRTRLCRHVAAAQAGNPAGSPLRMPHRYNKNTRADFSGADCVCTKGDEI